MARYMWCANHSFTSMEDLKKHLGRDEKVFISILPELEGSGLAESKRGILTEAEGKYSHQGILILLKMKDGLKLSKSTLSER